MNIILFILFYFIFIFLNLVLLDFIKFIFLFFRENFVGFVIGSLRLVCLEKDTRRNAMDDRGRVPIAVRYYLASVV